MRLIDVEHLGRPRVIGCWELDGVLIDPGPGSSLQKLLEAIGEESDDVADCEGLFAGDGVVVV